MPAAQGGHTVIIEIILIASSDVNAEPTNETPNWWTALQVSADTGHLMILKLLRTRGKHNNAPTTTKCGRLAFYATGQGANKNMISHLLTEKTDINALVAEILGRTALRAATERGYRHIVGLLL